MNLQSALIPYRKTVRLDATLIVAADVHDITDSSVDVVITATSG